MSATRRGIDVYARPGSPVVAEICAGSGLDWLLVDMEHAPNGLESVVAQLQAGQQCGRIEPLHDLFTGAGLFFT